MTTKTTNNKKGTLESLTPVKVDRDVSGKVKKLDIPDTPKPGKPRKLSDLIDLSANELESEYHNAFIGIMKRGLDRMPKMRVADFKSTIRIRLMVDSQPNRRQSNIVAVGKPDIDHAHVLHLWVGHPDYAKALLNGVWTTVVAHILGAGVEVVYKGNTLKYRSDGNTGGKITPGALNDLEAIGVDPESRIGRYRGTQALAKWAESKVIQGYLETLASMYVPVYAEKTVTTKKTTVTLICKAEDCKLNDLDAYGIKVKLDTVNDYVGQLKCSLHGALKQADES